MRSCNISIHNKSIKVQVVNRYSAAIICFQSTETLLVIYWHCYNSAVKHETTRIERVVYQERGGAKLSIRLILTHSEWMGMAASKKSNCFHAAIFSQTRTAPGSSRSLCSWQLAHSRYIPKWTTWKWPWHVLNVGIQCQRAVHNIAMSKSKG